MLVFDDIGECFFSCADICIIWYMLDDNDTEIVLALNIGPKSAEWLARAGIHSRKDLERLGAVEAYWKVKQASFNVSLNLLYALAGALSDTHWNKLPHDEKHRLMIELDAKEQQVLERK